MLGCYEVLSFFLFFFSFWHHPLSLQRCDLTHTTSNKNLPSFSEVKCIWLNQMVKCFETGCSLLPSKHCRKMKMGKQTLQQEIWDKSKSNLISLPSNFVLRTSFWCQNKRLVSSLESWLWPHLTVWPWIFTLTSQSSSFLISIVGIIVVLFYKICVRFKLESICISCICTSPDTGDTGTFKYKVLNTKQL